MAEIYSPTNPKTKSCTPENINTEINKVGIPFCKS